MVAKKVQPVTTGVSFLYVLGMSKEISQGP